MSSQLDSAATNVQRIVRGRITRRYLAFLQTFLVSWTLTVQSYQRGRKCRFAYKCVNDLLAKAQAHVRGLLVRRFLNKLKRERLSVYRKQICQLWQRTYTPLWYRTWFWTSINRYRFMHLGLHEDELIRLWSELGLKNIDYGGGGGGGLNSSRSVGSAQNSETASTHSMEDSHHGIGALPEVGTRLGQLLGGKTTAVYQRFSIVQRKLNSVGKDGLSPTHSSGGSGGGSSGGKSKQPVFPVEFAIAKDSTVSLKNPNVAFKVDATLEARKLLSKERDEILRTLSNCKKTARHGTLHRIYEAFKISDSAKGKKRRVVDLLWEHRAYAKPSIEVIRLNEGSTDEFGRSSLHGSWGVTDVYQSKIRDARNHQFLLQSAPLEDPYGAFDARYERQKEAVCITLGSYSWYDCRAVLIEDYLSCKNCDVFKSQSKPRHKSRSKGQGSSKSGSSSRNFDRKLARQPRQKSKQLMGANPLSMNASSSSLESGADSRDSHSRNGSSHRQRSRNMGPQHESMRVSKSSLDANGGNEEEHHENLRKYWERMDSQKIKPRRESSKRGMERAPGRSSMSSKKKNLDELENAFGF